MSDDKRPDEQRWTDEPVNKNAIWRVTWRKPSQLPNMVRVVVVPVRPTTWLARLVEVSA